MTTKNINYIYRQRRSTSNRVFIPNVAKINLAGKPKNIFPALAMSNICTFSLKQKKRTLEFSQRLIFFFIVNIC